MSLSSLATEEIRRTEPKFLQEQSKPLVHETTTKLFGQLNLAAAQVYKLEDDLLPLAASDPVKGGKASNAFDALTRYIPTEAVTLYVATASAMAALKQTFPLVTEAGVYWFFVILSPILFLIIFAGKRREAGLELFPPIKKWPWWKLIASTVAFAVWALAIPTTPYLHGVGGGAVAAFGALLVSTFLTVLQPIFEGKTD
jgi:hypothetical protein